MAYYKSGQIYVTPYSNTGVYTTKAAIANFTTSVVKPLVNLTAYFNATQEAGTPTPATPKAISGVSAVSVYHTGANLWNEVWEVGGIDNTTGDNYPTTSYFRSKDFIPVVPNSNIYIAKATNNTLGFRFYDSNKNFISSLTISTIVSITIPNNCYYVRFVNVSTNTYNNDISINYPSTDTEYHAYNGTTTLINLGGTYYGGYVTQDKDGKRELVVTHAQFIIDSNVPVYSWFENYKQVAFSNVLADKPAKYNGGIATYICDKLKAVSNYARADNVGNYISLVESGLGIGCSIPNCDTREQAEAFLQNNSILFVYELAEPFTIDLPDGEPITAFNGVNNVYNDSGDTSVTYTKLAYS